MLDGVVWGLWIAHGANRTSLPIAWLFHGLCSGLIIFGLVQTTARLRRQRYWPILPLGWTLLFAWPVAGALMLWLALRRLRALRPNPRRPRFGETQVPALERIEPRRPQRRIAGLGTQIKQADAALTLQRQFLTQLALRPTAAGNQTLTQLQEAGRHEDIRLLAYGVLDQQQQRLQRWIDQARALMDHRSNRTPRLLSVLAELHWEWAHQSLAHDDLRQHALRQCLHWLNLLQQQQGELHGHAQLLRLRALMALGEQAAAGAVVESMARAPDSSWLPYMAEWAYGKVCKTFLPDCRDGTIAT